jgi:hypothetical protein
LELADMIRERDRAKNDLTRMRGVRIWFEKRQYSMTISNAYSSCSCLTEPAGRIGPSS